MGEKISVIIPAYNIEGFLPATLDSVLVQTYQNLEIIVVNDGSSDATADVINDYAQKDNRIRAIHKENGGVTSARLRGVVEATGDYIGFVDGDDYIEPQMYERLIENLKQYDADISHCGYRMVFPSRVDYYYNTGEVSLQANQTPCADLLEGKFVEPALVNKLYRRALFDGLDGWIDKSIRINEDLLMNFYLFRRARIAVFEDICPYHYILRRGSAATSTLNAHKLGDPTKVLQILANETAAVPEWNRIVQRRLTYQLISVAMLSPGDQKALILPFRKEARTELRRSLADIVFGKACGVKLKGMALWAAIWPWSYHIVHKIYAGLRGSAKKYEVR